MTIVFFKKKNAFALWFKWWVHGSVRLWQLLLDKSMLNIMETWWNVLIRLRTSHIGFNKNNIITFITITMASLHVNGIVHLMSAKHMLIYIQ